MVFHWSLSDSKSPQVFRTLLGILAVLNNVVVRMVSTIIIIIIEFFNVRYESLYDLFSLFTDHY